MSVSTIGARLDQLHALVATLDGAPAPAGAATPVAGSTLPGSTAPSAVGQAGAASSSFAGALASAQLASSQTSSSAALGATDASTPFGAEIDAAATSNGIDPALLMGLVSQESGFDPNARSGAGALGLTQLMPGTAAGLGVSNPLDPAQSLQGGARYLREQLDRFGGDESLALAAYNAGPGAVTRYGGVPPYAETQGYVSNVLAKAAAYRGTTA